MNRVLEGLRSYCAIQFVNIICFLWFTATNVFAFTLAFGLRDPTRFDPPDQWKSDYGIGKETYLTPEPWIYSVLLLIHVLFAGTVAFAQFTDRGKDIVVGGLSIRWALLMLLSRIWTRLWFTQWYIASWVSALLIAVVAGYTNLILKRRYRLEHELDCKDEIFIHLPFSIFYGWSLFVLAFNTLAAFSPISLLAGLPSKIAAVWILVFLSGMAHLSAFSTRSGDIPTSIVLALGQFAVFAHQINRRDTNSQHLIAWFAFAFGFVSVWAVAKSVWGTFDVVRHSRGAVRLEGEEESGGA